jgi:hypothetical protein
VKATYANLPRSRGMLLRITEGGAREQECKR